jgi:aminoglycoside 6'-N-acetyltransferase
MRNQRNGTTVATGLPLRTTARGFRRFVRTDAEALGAYRSDPAVARYQSWNIPVTSAGAAELVREFAAGEPDRPGWFQYAIVHTAQSRLIGDLALSCSAPDLRTRCALPCRH